MAQPSWGFKVVYTHEPLYEKPVEDNMWSNMLCPLGVALLIQYRRLREKMFSVIIFITSSYHKWFLKKTRHRDPTRPLYTCSASWGFTISPWKFKQELALLSWSIFTMNRKNAATVNVWTSVYMYLAIASKRPKRIAIFSKITINYPYRTIGVAFQDNIVFCQQKSAYNRRACLHTCLGNFNRAIEVSDCCSMFQRV